LLVDLFESHDDARTCESQSLYIHQTCSSSLSRVVTHFRYFKYYLETNQVTYKYKPYTVNHNSMNGFIKVYFLHCFVQRHVSALVMSHLHIDYFS